MNKTSQPIPAVPRLKSLGNSLRFVRKPIEVLNGYMETYGDTFSIFIGGMFPGLFTAEAGLIQHVLQKNHRAYQKSPIHFEKMAHFLGNGLLTSEGEYWLRQRRMIQPGFHRDRLASLVDLMQSVLDRFIGRFEEKINDKKVVDINEEMLDVAFRIIAMSLLSEEPNEKELKMLSKNITQIQAFLARQIRQPYLEPWFRWSGQVKKHEAYAQRSEEVLLKHIRERKASGIKKDDLLQMLLDTRYEDTEDGMTEKQLLDEAMILFVAGNETSANALSWTWYLLAQHPKVVEKIRKELTEKIGDRDIQFADLRQLEYLTQVIEESMRLFPPAWITDRLAAEDDHYQGIDIKKGTTIITYIYGAHHSPQYWTDPEKFIPERFSKENKKNHPPFAYLPFGGGPRLCIGNSFAIMEMQLTIARMILRYDFELVKEQEVVMQPLITLRPKNGIKMRFWKR